MNKITLQDIADMLGISKGTVDRAVHNRPDVSYETRKKVLELIEKYDYKPDKAARSLSLKLKKTKIGIICQNNPDFFWNSVKMGINAAGVEISDFGLQLIYKDLENGRNAEDIILKMDEIIREKVDAIILVPADNSDVRQKIDEAVKRNIVVATLNDDITGTERIFYVGPQMRQSGRIAGELAVRFLKGSGKVVTVNFGLESLEYRERLEGFIELLKESGKNVNIIANYTFNYEMMGSNCDNIIKGILESTGDFDAIYDIDGAFLYNIGLIVKSIKKSDDVVLIGHEISENVMELLKDGTIHACISQDPYSQGYYAVKLMADYLLDGRKPVSERMHTRLDIILRENMDYKGNNIINPFYFA